MSLNICVGRCSEEQMIPRLAAAGFDGLDFNFCDLTDRIDWTDAQAVDDLLYPWKCAAENAKLAWVQAHGPMFNMFSNAPRDLRARGLCTAAIRACGMLGIPWMVLHPDVFAGPFDKPHRRAVLEGNATFFRSLLPDCEKAQVGIAIENIFDAAGQHGERNCPRFFGAVPDELCKLIDEWQTEPACLNFGWPVADIFRSVRCGSCGGIDQADYGTRAVRLNLRQSGRRKQGQLPNLSGEELGFTS